MMPLLALALVLVTWSAPATYIDGAPLAPADLDGYRLSWVLQNIIQPDVIVPAGATSYDLGDVKGRVCVALRAVANGAESEPTSVVCRKVKPGAPTALEVN